MHFGGTSAAPVELWLGSRVVSILLTGKKGFGADDGKAGRRGAQGRGARFDRGGQRADGRVGTATGEPDTGMATGVRLAGVLQVAGRSQAGPAHDLRDRRAAGTRAGATSSGRSRFPRNAGNDPELPGTVIARLGTATGGGRKDGRLTAEIPGPPTAPPTGSSSRPDTFYGFPRNPTSGAANNHRVFLEGLPSRADQSHYRIATKSEWGEAVVSGDRVLVPSRHRPPRAE